MSYKMLGTTVCYHCGESCDFSIHVDEKQFCCNGCKQVYLLLNENQLCQYYQLEKTPGISAKGKFVHQRFDFLDDDSVVKKIALFVGNDQVNIEFYLPSLHCSSCVFLLEKLNKINPAIIRSSVNFAKKTIFVSYNPKSISLRKLVELLAFIGYEPDISLEDASEKKQHAKNWNNIIQIGVAGFCFSNIMMLSFPEYFSGGNLDVNGLKNVFSALIFLLSLPVLFYSATPIFISAYKGLRQKQINIDLPIALASVITFTRSYYEILANTGSGYLDSGTGIIFFMLIGRWFQSKSYDALSFDRKYKSYFPLGVTIQIQDISESCITIDKLKIGDRVLTRNMELIPADSILISEVANLDYSFVTGENATQTVYAGEPIYAGGKQIGPSILTEVVKLPSQSYITELWNNSVFQKNKNDQSSFVHPWSRFFTLVLFSIAFLSGVYWYFTDANKVWLVVTAVLIVACPCSLLLSATFTYGNMQRILGKKKLFLKNANVIDSLSEITDVVFDKTGTITTQSFTSVKFHGQSLRPEENSWIKKATSHSSHVLSKSIFQFIESDNIIGFPTNFFNEIQGNGIETIADGHHIKLGKIDFVSSENSKTKQTNSEVHVSIDKNYKGYFSIGQQYRIGVETMFDALRKKYSIHILSGDHDSEREKIKSLIGSNAQLNFSVSPNQKLEYIKLLQSKGKKVLMVGDGLNDAGALMQANVGIAVNENQAHFTPASDGIIDGTAVVDLPFLLKYAKAGKKMVSIGFVVSICYNIIGVGYSIQGLLSPVFAAILMPISSITIVSLAIAISNGYGNSLKTPSTNNQKLFMKQIKSNQS